MTEEEILRSIELLRARRQSLGELRDYKPQKSKGKAKAKAEEPEVDVGDVFSDLIKPAEGA